MQHCSAGPAQSRQKYPKIGQISGFLIFLNKIRVAVPPPSYFGAVETKKIGHFPRKTPFSRLFEFSEKTVAKIVGGVTSFSHAQSGPWAQMVLFWLGKIRFLKSLLKAKPVRGPGGGD